MAGHTRDVHSDREPRYLSGDFDSALRSHKMRQSTSGVANCCDNSSVESFFSSLK